MPKEVQLDIKKTFEEQKDQVTRTIIPTLMKTLDLVTYPIGEGVIYEMIHMRHHHQRENDRNKKKSETEKERSRKETQKFTKIRGKYIKYSILCLIIYLLI